MLNSSLRAALVASSVLMTAGCGDGGFLDGKLPGMRKTEDAKPQPADACTRPTVKRITKKQTGYDADTFSYAFQYIPPASPELPTIVYIPGGPGQTSIGSEDEWREILPEGYGMVLTDPRGVGCNYLDSKSIKREAFFTSEAVAEDVLDAVDTLGLTRYSLYGISYGTVVATIAGAKSEQRSLKPDAVILEGVLGRAFKNGDEVDATYSALWDAKLAKLGAEEGAAKADAFRGSEFPLGYTAMQWYRALRYTLMFGAITASDGTVIDVTYELAKRAQSDNADEVKWARRIIDRVNEKNIIDAKGSNLFYGYIACREVFGDWRDPVFAGGAFTRTGDNICAEIDPLLNAFDAKKWQTTAKVYYLEGTDDPATPQALARYHYDSQTLSPTRELLLVKDAGHNPFEGNMSDCGHAVWDAMNAKQSFSTVLDGCKWARGFELVKP